MGIVSGSIPNLINGVSQQPFALRLASQAERQLNAYSSVAEGLTKRPPTKHVAKLDDRQVGPVYLHRINRDVGERYVVMISNGDLKVWTIDGQPRTVNFPNGRGYLASGTANFAAVTVADYTFIVNKDVTVGLTGETQPTRGMEALVYVKQGNYATTYNVILDNGAVYSLTTGTTDGTEIQTQNIAGRLAEKIRANADFAANQVGSTLHIFRKNGGDFNISTSDTLGDNAMLCIKRATQSFTNLPVRAVGGYQVEITGAVSNGYDNFFVQYDDTSGSAANTGIWREIAKPGRQIALDANTMPWILVREANGSFTCKPADWAKCLAGSNKSLPQPSFVGRKLADVFFYRNRLGFIADENVIFSRSADYFNFWRATARQLLDTDPVDVAVSHVKVSILRHAIAFNESLLLFSDQTQFVLSSGDALTPGSVAINPTTEFETALKAKPVGAGSFVYFCTTRGAYTGVREYYVDGQSKTNNANDVTSHVPRYITGAVSKLCASTNESILLALSAGEPNVLYAYKYYYSGQEKVQSSWSRWALGGQDKILSADFIESALYLIVQRVDGVYLDVMNIEPGTTDTDMPYTVHLDRRTLAGQMVNVVYRPATGETEFALPWAVPVEETLQVVCRGGDGNAVGRLLIPRLLQANRQVWAVKGNVSRFFAGIVYRMSYKFSPLIIRQDAPGGGQVATTEGRLQIRKVLINYAETGYFRVEVTPLGRDTYTTTFTGRTLGAASNVLGQPAISTGSFTFSVMSNNLQTDIILVNDTPFPCRLLNADWEGQYSVRTKRIN